LMAVMEGKTAPDLRGATLDGARLMALTTGAMDDIRDMPLDGFNNAVKSLQAAGATVDTVDLPFVDDMLALSPLLYAPEAYGIWKDVIEAAPEKMYPPILERFRGGAEVSAADYVAAWRKLDGFRQQWAEATAGFDAVVIPTAPNLPPDAARLMSDDAYYVTENLLTLRNTRIGNLLGNCSLTLPTGVPSTGILLMAPPMAEERLLRLSFAAEATLS